MLVCEYVCNGHGWLAISYKQNVTASFSVNSTLGDVSLRNLEEITDCVMVELTWIESSQILVQCFFCFC